MSMKFAGNVVLLNPRLIVTVPSSSGWRNTSSVVRLNSGNSSRNNTPLFRLWYWLVQLYTRDTITGRLKQWQTERHIPTSHFQTPKQKKSASEDRQRDLSTHLAKKNNWHLNTTLKIADLGRSAYKGFRKGLHAFLKAVEEGQVEDGSILIVEKLDRLTRADIDAGGELFKNILRAGVDIANCQPEKIYTAADLKSLAVGIEIMVTLYVNWEHSQKLSDRLNDKWNRRREAGKRNGGQHPAWIKMENGQPKLDKKKAKVIRQIYAWAIEGLGERVITREN